MQIPELKECCCGFSIRNGTIVISILGAVASLLTISSYISDLNDPIFVPKKPDLKHHESFYQTLALITLICLIAQFVISVLLLNGAINRQPRYVIIWIVVTTVILVISLLSSFAEGSVLIANNFKFKGILIIVGSIFATTIAYHLMVVVINFKREITCQFHEV